MPVAGIISSLNVYSLILSGWSSNSKYAALGGLRAIAQMISYEAALSLCVIPVFLLSGGLSLCEIVMSQQNGFFFDHCCLAPLFFLFVVWQKLIGLLLICQKQKLKLLLGIMLNIHL